MSIGAPDRHIAFQTESTFWHQVCDPHFDTLVAVGYIDGVYPLSFGSSITGFAAADGEVAFREGANFLDYGADLSADTVYLVSTSASDTQEFSVQGIDANGDAVTVTVTATGTTPVALSGTWNHVQRCICTGADNIGTVYISTDAAALPTTVGDQIQTVMLPGENYAISPLLVVPNNQLFTINQFDFSQDVNQSALIKVFAKRQGKWLINFKFFGGKEDNFEQGFHTPLRLFEGDSMKVTVTASGGATSKATFGMNGNIWDKSNLNSQKLGIGEIYK